jgi:riboflavin kinase/FMN adenylyltransferase
MRILSPLDETPHDLRGAAIALGNFDGVHLGHQSVIAAARAAAGAGLLGAAVFEPHPRAFFAPHAPAFRLQSPDQRARALGACGVNAIFEIGFDGAIAAMTPREFATRVLKERIGASQVCIGFDFRYGKDRAGDCGTLRRDGADLGFDVHIVDAVDDAAHPDHKVSSSAIRKAIQSGDMQTATRFLSRPWAIEGVVGPGQQRGRTIGFPTANLRLGAYLHPRFGVYAVRVDVGDGQMRAGVANIGVRPTVAGDSEPMLEAHLFDFNTDLYGRRIETTLLHFLRPEQKFEDFEALKAQIAEDAAQARALLA